MGRYDAGPGQARETALHYTVTYCLVREKENDDDMNPPVDLLDLKTNRYSSLSHNQANSSGTVSDFSVMSARI